MKIKSIFSFILIVLILGFGVTKQSMAEPPEGKHKKYKQKHQKKLPPGLQKKLQRGGELPPGWKKKLTVGARLDDTVYARGVQLDLTHRANPYDHVDGTVVIRVEDKVIRLLAATREIVDILH